MATNMKQHIKERDDAGFILITSMLMLLLLSFIGIIATNNSSVEMMISGNDRTAKEIFYEAEAAAVESAGLMQNENDPDELIAARTSKPWLLPLSNDGSDPVGTSNVGTTWQDNTYLGTQVSGIDAGGQAVKLAVVDHGILAGASASSIKITASSIHGYRLFGYAEKNNGWKLIEIGFKIRF